LAASSAVFSFTAHSSGAALTSAAIPAVGGKGILFTAHLPDRADHIRLSAELSGSGLHGSVQGTNHGTNAVRRPSFAAWGQALR